MAHAHPSTALAPTSGTRARVSSTRSSRCATLVPRASRGGEVGRTDALSERARAFLASGLAATTVLAAVAPVARAIDLVIVDPSVKQYMDSRDDAMRMKCEGGMMDCDGDRREYAKQATENFIRRNSGDVFEPPPCTVAEACTTDILGAAMAGLNGLTTSEKLEKMGKNGDAVNATRPYFGDAVGNEAEAR